MGLTKKEVETLMVQRSKSDLEFMHNINSSSDADEPSK
jgi:hypothetical protein